MFILIAICFATALAKNIPWENKYPETRIINGKLAELGQFPWQVALDVEMPIGRGVCAGSLINPNFVLTAAHCTIDATNITLRFGSLYYRKGGVIRTTNKFIRHEKFDSYFLYNDIAVIFFPEAVELTDAIQTIGLPSLGNVVEAGEKLYISGWGTTENADNDYLLRYVDVESITNKQCDEEHRTDKNQVCCIGHEGKSTCNGDSGGPLVKLSGEKPLQVGIDSFGHWMGCKSGKPFGFARTESYINWIFDAIVKLIDDHVHGH